MEELQYEGNEKEFVLDFIEKKLEKFLAKKGISCEDIILFEEEKKQIRIIRQTWRTSITRYYCFDVTTGREYFSPVISTNITCKILE